MDSDQLKQIYGSITEAVAKWLKHQDDMTRVIHRVIVDNIQAGCEAPAMVVVQDLHERFPGRWEEDYCEIAVAFRAAEILNSEFRPLSRLFGNLYDDFNNRY